VLAVDGVSDGFVKFGPSLTAPGWEKVAWLLWMNEEKWQWWKTRKMKQKLMIAMGKRK